MDCSRRREFTPFIPYDKNGKRTSLTIKYNSNVAFVKRYAWDQDDRLIRQWNENSGGTVLSSVEFRYCRTCGGQRTARIQKDGSGTIVSWKRYEMEGLNHLRIDERYDSDSNGLDDTDPWRIERVTINGPGQLGQIMKQIVYSYASATTGTVDSTSEYFLGYDVLGNVSVISNGVVDGAGNEVDQFEQDAFGNQVENSWTNPAGGITEHLTTKQYDSFMGLYYFNARWYDPQAGAFVSRDPAKEETHDYVFVYSSPVSLVDPTGLQSCFYLSRFSIGPGSHRALIEEVGQRNARSHVIAELFNEDGIGLWYGSMNDSVGYYLRYARSGVYSGTSNIIVGMKSGDGPLEYDDITQYCNAGCLQQGAQCANWAQFSANHKNCQSGDNACYAYTDWMNMERPNAGGPPMNPGLNSKPWGMEYAILKHNSNNYINCLLNRCCPSYPYRFTPQGNRWNAGSLPGRGCQQIYSIRGPQP